MGGCSYGAEVNELRNYKNVVNAGLMTELDWFQHKQRLPPMPMT